MDRDAYRRATAAHTAAGLALDALTEARVEAATDNAAMYGVLVEQAARQLADALEALRVDAARDLPVYRTRDLKAAIVDVARAGAGQ